MPSARVVIVGGGVSGLSTAYFLAKLGLSSTIIEKSGRLGGLIRTDSIQGCQLEAGPDSYLAAKPSVTQLAEDLGDLKSQIIHSNDDQRRIFVVTHGHLLPMPKGMVMMAPAQLWPALRSNFFSARTKLRFLLETRFPPRQRPGDVSVEELVKSHFGEEVFNKAAEPLLSGVYGGDARALSAESVLPRFLAYEREYGSLIEGVRQERRTRSQTGSLFQSFRGGMQSLTDSLAEAIAGAASVLHLNAAKVERTATGWRVCTEGQSIDADQVVLACPAHCGAKLIETASPPLAAELAAIPYSSAILVTLVYRRVQFQHALDGFGFLVPRAERQTISAATWVSTKFPSRVPEHLVALRAFILDPQATATPEESGRHRYSARPGRVPAPHGHRSNSGGHIGSALAQLDAAIHCGSPGAAFEDRPIDNRLSGPASGRERL